MADDIRSESWRVTTHSSVFDNTSRLEIGRYDLVLARSRLAFFRRGVMYVNLNTSGKVQDVTDLLNNTVINGANKSTNVVFEKTCWQWIIGALFIRQPVNSGCNIGDTQCAEIR